MEELTDQARDMLEALKAEETPTKASSDRMWGAVAGGAVAAAAVGLSKGKLLLLGTLGVTGVVALVLWAGPGSDTQVDSAGVGPGSGGGQVAVAAEPEPEPEPEPALDPEPELTPQPGPPPESEAVEVVESEPPPPEPAAHKTTPRPTPRPEPAPNESADLERELSLLARAKGALRRGDAKGALSRLDAHREDFPRSTFAEERDLLRMTALCELGQREQARREVDAFLGRNPSSALTSQVRRVCEGE